MDQCTFTSADLNFHRDVLERLRLDEWECSRRVWEEHDRVSDRCVWHVDTTDKPRNELKNTVESGDLHGAIVPSETDLSEFSFPEKTGLNNADLSGADLREADLSGADLRDTNLSRANLRQADLSEGNLIGSNLSGAVL